MKQTLKHYVCRKIQKLAALLLLLLMMAGCSLPPELTELLSGAIANESTTVTPGIQTQINGTTSTPLSSEQYEELTVHFIDIGQGDCILITCGDAAMLIDAGDNQCATKFALYMDKLSIFTLDYVIGTHPDADHIGGLDVALYRYDCKTILMPDFTKDTRTYEEVENSLASKNYQITYPVVGETYSFGDASFQIVAPNGTDYDTTNDYSIAILMTHGENRFLFAGDAEETSEEEMLANGYDLSADVYKVSHHGSKSSTSENFVEAVSPTYAVISCGEGNDYGHPHAEVLNRLRTAGVKLFRTDEQGTVTVTSDGFTLTWNCQPTESWIAGEPGASKDTVTPTQRPDTAGTETSSDSTSQITYILNTGTMKIHLPDCDSVESISPANRKVSSKTREELEAEGYTGCKRCMSE